jgi:hypothetical protein
MMATYAEHVLDTRHIDGSCVSLIRNLAKHLCREQSIPELWDRGAQKRLKDVAFRVLLDHDVVQPS